MAQTINTNIASLTAQRNLAASQKDAATAMQRLSSGLRINSAKDDAAGLAIANRLTSQINGINQAVRNANDAISVVQIAEGALAESGEILQRMRELAVQAGNASNSADDRANLQAEVDNLTSELDRIASTTAFGNTKLLNGSFSNQSFQVGANVGETVSVSIASAAAADMGTVNTATFAGWDPGQVTDGAGTATDPMAQQTLTFDVDGTEHTVAVAAGDSSKTIAASISQNVPGLTATAKTHLKLDQFSMGSATGTTTVTINGTALTSVDVTSAANFFSDIATKGEAADALNGLTFTATTSQIIIADADGDDITVAFGAVAGATNAKVDVTTLQQDGSTEITSSSELEESEEVIAKGDIDFTTTHAAATTLQVKSSVASNNGIANTAYGDKTLTASTARISTVDVSTQANANSAIATLDAAISSISSQRASLGAVQSRLDSVVSNLMNVSENSAAAKSRIMDADFASETAALAKNQILQQAGISVLAQANAQPQNVLALLQ